MRVLPVLILSLASAACSLPRWPVQAPLSSAWGVRFEGLKPDMHKGVDIAVPVGTPVAAMKAGTVEFAGEMRGYGLIVVVRHGGTLRTRYGHLSSISVKQGDHVDGGQVIGLSGQSGNATGPHLHFEVERWGRDEDPVPLLGGPPHK
jgi:murein DD-endopeptidase MepM/ murein hydrolase activator NlpD